MREIAKKHQERLQEHKKMVEAWHQYWRYNNERFWEFTKFVCATSLSSSDIATLNTLDKPTVQFNILEAMVSKLRSQFSSQEPGFEVRAADGVPLEALTEEFVKTEEIIEGYLRAIFDDATNDGLQSNIHTDQLIGGFSALWVRTDYVNEMSFEQNIKVERVFDPTMTFFDPLARASHKGDGNYCGMLIPYTKERFVKEYGEEAARDIKFMKGAELEGFGWSYQSQDQDIILVAYLFEKKFKKKKIVKLSNGHVVPLEQYERLIELWDVIEQPPVILEQRETSIETIVHYQFCETKELYYAETDYKYLPIIFVDGNSVLIKGDSSTAQTGSSAESTGVSVQQMTRPYVYHAKDAQRAKNFAGQTMMAEIENMVMHKFMVAVEAIPEDYQEAYKNPQQANVLVYNTFDEKTRERLDPPREIQRTPTPPIVESTFMNSDMTIQMSLGSHELQSAVNQKDLSGIAIQQGALQTDGAAGPYLINYIKAWNRLGQIVIDLIPKYYVTPRSLPVIKKDGKRAYEMINDKRSEESISMNYDPNTLQVKVEAGVNSAVQKQIALDQLIRMSSSNEQFNAFMNQYGLPIFLDNLDIRGIDHLKAKAEEFIEQQQKMAQEASQKPDPVEMEMQAIQQIEMAKVQQRAQEAEGKLAIQSAQLALDKEKADLEFVKLMSEIEAEEQKTAREIRREDSEDTRDAIDVALEMVKLHHEQNKED